MNKDDILNILKKITYPGFSRDIVSFGMVKNIIVDDEIVTVNINIKSQNEEKKNQLIDEIKSTLLSESPFKEIKVDIGVNVSDSKGPQPTAQQGPSTISGIKHIS